jgi:hypothetical protein
VGTDTSVWPSASRAISTHVARRFSTGAQTGSTGRVQEGVDLVSGSTVLLGPGNYSDNVVISSHVNVIGSGSGSNPAVDSIITSAAASTPVFRISGAAPRLWTA